MKAVCHNFQNCLEVTGFLQYVKCIQWNPVNTDTRGTYAIVSVLLIRVVVLSGLSEKTSGTHVLSI